MAEILEYILDCFGEVISVLPDSRANRIALAMIIAAMGFLMWIELR